MKRILTYTIFCLLFVLTSCSEEQLDVYNGDNYVYFTYMSDKSPQKITFNFATDARAPIRAYNKCIGSAIPDTSLQVCHQPAYPKGKPKGEYSIPANP